MDISSIMLAVIVSLMPATGFAIYYFGFSVLYIVLVTTASAVLTEVLFCLLYKKALTIGDNSAVVTGLLLALCLPPQAPLWLGAVGAFFAIFVVKMLFGGMGQNIMNPAMAGRCFLLLFFAPVIQSAPTDALRLSDMWMGYMGGMIGETSLMALLLGAIVLLLLGIISLWIPATYLISFLLFVALFTNSYDIKDLLNHLSGGTLILAAFFMATDHVTRPLTAGGKFIYGILLGFLTAIFRVFGSGIEAVAFALIIANLTVPLIEKYSHGRRFVAVKGRGKSDEV
jgi:Na+-translocating ferredoxin:NAD+ oxidoreductase RnfD subunit